MSSVKYWVWLSALRGLSSAAISAALAEVGSPMEVFYAPAGRFGNVENITDREASLLDNKDMLPTELILNRCREKGIRILTLQDADYPHRLKQIYDPPAVLYVRGTLPEMDETPVIGIVGTRKCTVYGEKTARNLGYQIASGGGIVTTGLALGVDGAAARGVLMAGGICVGVLGCAIDVAYPAAHVSLIEDVAATGCVMSEFPPGSSVMDFPRRNRIMSGLSCGVCIVEAPERSGALITAALALEQGRDLFAVPGNIDSPCSAGSNRLLREGARVVLSGADILEEYRGAFSVSPRAAVKNSPYETASPEPEYIPVQNQKKAEKADDPAKSALDKQGSIAYIDVESRADGCSADQLALLKLLSGGVKQADELIVATGFSAAKTMAELTLLSIRGLVEPLPGKRYTLKTK